MTTKAYGSITITDVTDGKQLYTWIMYADDENGANMSEDSTGKAYIGHAYNQTEPTPNKEDPSLYEWALFANREVDKTDLYYVSASDKTPPEISDSAMESGYWKHDFPTAWSSDTYIWTTTRTDWANGDITYAPDPPRLISQIEAATLSAQMSEKSLAEWCTLNNVTIIDGSTIAAGSIDVDKISVTDLNAFDATIGGFKISNEQLYTNNKSSFPSSTTVGVYVGTDGISVGGTLSIDENLQTYNANIILDASTGKLTANYADISGKITTKEGDIGGWRINSDKLIKDNAALHSNNKFGVPLLRHDYLPWAENSIVRFSAGKTVSTTGEYGSVCRDYDVGATVEFGGKTTTYYEPTGVNVNGVYLQLPFWCTADDFDTSKMSFELLSAWLLWENVGVSIREYLGSSESETSGHIDMSIVQPSFSENTAALFIPIGAIHTKTVYQKNSNSVRLKCRIRVKFDDESLHYLSAPFLVTDNGSVLADRLCTIDGSVVVTSSQFERGGGEGSRITFEPNVWKWHSEIGGIGAKTTSDVLGGYVYGSMCSDIFTFYPVLSQDNFSIDVFGNKYPGVELFKKCNFVGYDKDAYAAMDNIDVAVKANGLWNFNNTVQFSGTVKDKNGAPINTSDINAKNSVKMQPEIYSRLFDKLQPSIFKYNDGTSDRYHTGLIAQDIENAMIELGVDSKDFAALCYEKDEDGNKYDYGIRYTELVSMCIHEIQKLKTRVAELEGESRNS